ncbi:hypothetical protein GIB67_032639 [Kingdonia uniflora]|uniref:Uncharacterized protein n=1 Tax=Kingdonia uniflora TaxID=39325 RepID=A0A7J7P9D0_9MAGN|nr:hypothetical protein GIB67_032639 [Kingdonia uniflora]
MEYHSSEAHQTQKDNPKSNAHFHNQHIAQTKEGTELVKYMSKLPTYLQQRRVESDKGDNLQEKALNFGVLDWGRLEKWKDTQKQIPVTGSSSIRVRPSPVFNISGNSSHDARQGKQSLAGKAAVFQKQKTFDSVATRQNNTRAKQSLESSKIKPEKGKGVVFRDPKIIKNVIPSSSTGKINAGVAESTKTIEQFQEFRLPDQHSPGTQKTIVLLLPRDGRKSCSNIPPISESTTVQTNRMSFSESFCVNNEVQFGDLYSGIPHSCALPSIGESSTQSKGELCRPVVSEVDASNDKHVPTDVKAMKHVNRSSPKAVKSEVAKGRCPSPSNSSIGQMSRSFSSREVSCVPKLNSTYVVAKSGPVGSDASPCLDNSDKEKINANSRAKSSPLRRLLNPLLKPKAAKSQSRSIDPVQDGTCETVPIVKRSLKFASCDPTKTDDSYQGDLSMVQALLKVTVKEGLPSFTFAVDKNSDILAATMKKAGATGKYDCSWIYTFFSFHKTKKKSGGWINQGSKGKSLDYVPKVAGRMKVASSGSPKVTRHSSKDQYMTREFVLLSAECGESNDEILQIQPDSELAAIIVKVPIETIGENMSKMGLREDLQIESNGESRSQFSTTVILPSGVHGLSTTGVPSTLIGRWRSGGLCDCGGWDVGCELRILGSQDQRSKNLTSSKDLYTPDHLDLFVQGGGTSDRPMFSLGTFEEGIYAIGFNSSISSLQAFSICTAILHSRKLAELSEMSRLLEDKISVELVSAENSIMKAPILTEGEIPPTYVTFPPLSPAGRV